MNILKKALANTTNTQDITLSSDIIAKINEFILFVRPIGLLNICSIDPNGNSGLIGQTFLIPDDIENCCQFIIQQNKNNRNIYWTVNETINPINGKPKKIDIKEISFSHVDIDPDGDNYLDARRELLSRANDINQQYKPSLVVDSGNGIQIFWRHQ